MAELSVQPSSKQRVAPRRDPFGILQGEINRLFSGFDRGWPDFSGFEFRPSTDVSETEKEIKVTAELPGLETKDVKIELADDILTISGEKKSESEDKTGQRHVVERSYGSFSRSLQLPSGVKAEDVQASLANGVLTVTVKKPENQKPQPQTISVTASK